MKNKSLFRKSMFLILIPCAILSIVLVIGSQRIIKDYFREESFRQLNHELQRITDSLEAKSNSPNIIEKGVLNSLLNRFKSVKGTPLREFKSADRVSYTYIMESNNGSFRPLTMKLPFNNELPELLSLNDHWPKEGVYLLENENIFYSITKLESSINEEKMKSLNLKNIYLVAYISESYSTELTRRVMLIFIIGIGALLGCILLVLGFIFRNISHRLHNLEEGTSKIGRGQFDSIISNKPHDEIGRLGEAMNRMGKQLSIIQEEKADDLQMISHELKTPIMVIQGYMDALIHDQYPNGTKEASYRIITDELSKLESLTKDLILINKADYLSRNNVEMKELKLSQLFKQVIEKLHDDTIDIRINGEHTLIGDEESWLRIIENIITNQFRYAKSIITINLDQEIKVFNDGEHIEESLIDRIMKPFVKGKSGRSGLGLTIIINTLKLYQYELKVDNINEGVLYTISKVIDA